MTRIGRVDSLWRYPVKSMQGERITSAWLGTAGLAGDREFAFLSSAAPAHFPYLTGRSQPRMLLCRPLPALKGDTAELQIETAEGDCLSIDNPLLLARLGEGLAHPATLALRRMATPQTDAQPISLFSLQTVAALGQELETVLDARRFRANLYVDFPGRDGFFEDSLVGREVSVGETVLLSVVERDPRCKMITLDPDTAEADPAVIRHIASAHERCAGVYATVLVEGEVREGDRVVLRERP